MNLENLHTFLNDQPTCVVARVNTTNGASAATVGFSHDKNFSFLIATNQSTRKFKDITNNPHVALVIGTEMPITVQVEGTAEVVTPEQLGDRLEQHFNKVPAARNFAGDSGQKYIVIKPTWLRYVNMKNPSETFEMKEFV